MKTLDWKFLHLWYAHLRQYYFFGLDSTTYLLCLFFFRANKVIDALCEEVKRGEAVGNSCQWICDRHYTLLNYYEGGSKTVLKMRFNDTDRVFKMKHRFSHEYKPFDATTDDEKFTKKVGFIQVL